MKHIPNRLLRTIDAMHNVALLILVDNHVFRRGNQAVLYTTITTDGILVGSGVEKAQVERGCIAFIIGW